ncbi:hypothetical protein K461DRAFT_313895 [Myriangium duriaei CBS 260.36]|uniref:2EXR domain-containing protein n=1 Tax=Myriangium duriaei CBS 260.36 TaxID=1168546 RepID=A0A9P4IWH1_9PEZI|nr:hypothetical protein K461DRAFT_313895 [Myriangium duriaei CBS 260.36]
MTLFTLFPKLPPELRNQVWRAALPELIGPALYFWEPGHWRKTWVISDNEDDEKRIIDFRYDLLDDAHFDVPLAFVNHEARDIAVQWCFEHGIAIRQHATRPTLVFKRAFNPQSDALYMPVDLLTDCIHEPYNLCLQQPRWLNSDFYSCIPGQSCIAISEAVLSQDEMILIDSRYGAERINVIVNAPLDLQYADYITRKRYQRWEMDILPGGVIRFDTETCSFIRDGDETTKFEDTYMRIMRQFEAFSMTFGQIGKRFEVQPVLVVRKLRNAYGK